MGTRKKTTKKVWKGRYSKKSTLVCAFCAVFRRECLRFSFVFLVGALAEKRHRFLLTLLVNTRSDLPSGSLTYLRERRNNKACNLRTYRGKEYNVTFEHSKTTFTLLIRHRKGILQTLNKGLVSLAIQRKKKLSADIF